MPSNNLTAQQIARAKEVYNAAVAFGDPDPLGFVAQGYQESKFKANAVSNKNARGEWQFIPETAARFGVDTTDPNSSMLGALKYRAYIRDYNLKRFGVNNEEYTWAGYNAGEGRSVYAASNIAETRDYIAKIKAHKAMFAPLLTGGEYGSATSPVSQAGFLPTLSAASDPSISIPQYKAPAETAITKLSPLKPSDSSGMESLEALLKPPDIADSTAHISAIYTKAMKDAMPSWSDILGLS